MLARIKDMRKPEPMAVLYPGWWEIDPPVPRCRAYRHTGRGLLVLHSIDLVDEEWWDHLSVSHKDRLPFWTELREVKNYFLGANREAIQVLPREVDYVNLAKNCLHIWAKCQRELCPACGGTGAYDGLGTSGLKAGCEECDGTGEVQERG